jgi:plasmid stabilization system protein ParE
MKIKLSSKFRTKLERQVRYIAKDKPAAARKFKTDLLSEIRKISDYPYSFRPSIYFENENIREMIFKGYVIIFQIDSENKIILVFALLKHEDFSQ